MDQRIVNLIIILAPTSSLFIGMGIAKIISKRKRIKSYIKTKWSQLTALTIKQIYRRIRKKIKKLIKKETKIMRKRVLEVSLKKQGFDNIIHLKAAPEIEDFFRRAASQQDGSDIETSAKWLDENGEGLNFYVKNEKLSGKVSGHGSVMDNFGNGLMDNGGRINLALLRIVGISDDNGVTIKTDDLLGYEEAKQYIELVASWAKSFYEENLRDQEITSSITFEV